tara:strand:+ start:491 stop:625 length:135 start_codon:yes stop_codon:yes gene_type:complete
MTIYNENCKIEVQKRFNELKKVVIGIRKVKKNMRNLGTLKKIVL